MTPILAEYIWIDGTAPSKALRSKTKVLFSDELEPSYTYETNDEIPLSAFPEWGADGSSTQQAEGDDSDIVLKPVNVVRDPTRAGGFLVLCEVFAGNGEVHSTNTRAALRRVMELGGAAAEPMFGFEQEYTLMRVNGTPAGFPEGGLPGPQGPYYCAVGANNITGREFYEDFMAAAIEAQIGVTGFNFEVMPGQAEVQVAGSNIDAADHIWFARYLLARVGEDHDVVVSFDAKPALGDWNGAGMHVNFSTKEMRAAGGLGVIERACQLIGAKREEHLAVYGHNYQARLTGAHETCSYKEFRYGVADRTASIRIPRNVATSGCGYLEDRRPNANADPYEVAARLLKTVLELD